MHCPKCQSQKGIKNGWVRGLQRRKCEVCGCNYTKSESRGYPKWIKRRAVQFYLEGVGLRQISRILGVADVTVGNWMKMLSAELQKIRRTAGQTNAGAMELEEAQQYMHEKKFGYGSLVIGRLEGPAELDEEIVLIKRKKGRQGKE